MSVNQILYLGSYLDEDIVRERGLPSQNAAGSNRMLRISRALSAAGCRPVILSAATSLRSHGSRRLLHPARVRRNGKVVVVFAPALNLWGLNILTTFFFQLGAMVSILARRRHLGVIVYNFNISLIALSAIIKAFYRIPVLQNVEDVSKSRLSDWLPGAEARPLQQIVFAFCMKSIATMVDGYIVPTSRFLAYLPRKKRNLLVTGCIDVQTNFEPPVKGRQIQLLFAGKIEREHGALVLAEALSILDGVLEPGRLTVNVTGAGSMSNIVREQIYGFINIAAEFHGFTTAAQYQKLLKAADICVALQDPEGRYADFKTPSKVYEFLGFGKAVISTRVGDISELPEGTVRLLPFLTADELSKTLQEMLSSEARIEYMKQSAHAFALANFSYASVGFKIRNEFSEISEGRE